ncbi:RNA polymerase sigma factor [Streptomyces sp. NPDC020800]|uniref:RNA polymerase sigma factor n=1 Tax=Streptomyces sp. NPDC020800 TaxID=3365092 RepID=UPI0037B19216
MKPHSDPTPVIALLSRAQAGDEQAMNELLTGIRPYVAKVCTPIAGSSSSDAVQEALLAIYRGLGSLREPAAFFGWVRSVTRREALRTAKGFKEQAPAAYMEAGQVVNPLESVHINDVLDRLSEQHRQVLKLRFYGLSEGEMATILALPLGTVRSRLFRARRSFQEAWQPHRA